MEASTSWELRDDSLKLEAVSSELEVEGTKLVYSLRVQC